MRFISMLSNEDLALAIQNGETEKIELLWEQTRAFIAKCAHRYVTVFDNKKCGAEVDDLIQSGYFALLSAVESYSVMEDGRSFIGWLLYFLSKEFARTAGLRRYVGDDGKQHYAVSVLDEADSLERPLSADTDSLTLGDTLPSDYSEIDDADQRIYTAQLHEVLEALLSELDADEAGILRRHYFDGIQIPAIAKETGADEKETRRKKARALRSLQRKAMTTEQGKELRRFVEDQTDYYLRVGVFSFNTTRSSAPEALVLKREALERKYAAGIMSGVD